MGVRAGLVGHREVMRNDSLRPKLIMVSGKDFYFDWGSRSPGIPTAIDHYLYQAIDWCYLMVGTVGDYEFKCEEALEGLRAGGKIRWEGLLGKWVVVEDILSDFKDLEDSEDFEW